MLVEETQTIVMNPDNPSCTVATTEARIVSNTAFVPIRSRIEGFGLTRFKKNAINVIYLCLMHYLLSFRAPKD